MITKIQRPRKETPAQQVKSTVNGQPNLLVSIPPKEGEDPVEFAKRFLKKLAGM